MSAPHPDVTAFVAAMAEAGVPPYDRAGVIRARAILDGVTRSQGPATAVAQVRDVLLPGDAGLLPARVYDPSPGTPAPLVVYLHGGGWALGGVRAADRPCRALAAASGCVVVSLEYRRAPETRFPGPLLDCVAAVRALAADPGRVGAAADAGLVLVGDSAGGNLAAGTSVVLGRGVVTGQVLVYPCLFPAAGSPYPSMTEHAAGPLMTRAELAWFWDLYLGADGDASDPRAVPLRAADLGEQPPTHVVTAELDPLRDEGLAYAARLAEAGVPVGTTTYPGAAHGFWWLDAVMSQAGELTAELAGLVHALRRP
ncbi:hypothetical protein GCM10027047_30470 [Rhodococcus aerolatus]